MYTEGSGRKERGQVQTSWRGAGQTELAVQTGASLSFWTLKEKRKDEKQQSKMARKRVRGDLFRRVLEKLQAAPGLPGQPRHTGSIDTTPDSGRPLPHGSPFRVSGLFTGLRSRKGINTQTHGSRGGSRGQREVLVFDRATDDGHAHTVVESSVRDSFTAVEAPTALSRQWEGDYKSQPLETGSFMPPRPSTTPWSRRYDEDHAD